MLYFWGVSHIQQLRGAVHHRISHLWVAVDSISSAACAWVGGNVYIMRHQSAHVCTSSSARIRGVIEYLSFHSRYYYIHRYASRRTCSRRVIIMIYWFRLCTANDTSDQWWVITTPEVCSETHLVIDNWEYEFSTQNNENNLMGFIVWFLIHSKCVADQAKTWVKKTSYWKVESTHFLWNAFSQRAQSKRFFTVYWTDGRAASVWLEVFADDVVTTPALGMAAVALVACTRVTWSFKFDFRVNDSGHLVHLNMRSFVCNRRWQRNEFLPNIRLHSGHGIRAFFVISHLCSISWKMHSASVGVL